MLPGLPERTREARETSERALAAVVRQYGDVPDFVVLGGLVPDVLCTRSTVSHAGTSDVDVQVDLEIAQGSANAPRLERAKVAAARAVGRPRTGTTSRSSCSITMQAARTWLRARCSNGSVMSWSVKLGARSEISEPTLRIRLPKVPSRMPPKWTTRMT